jgi:hypothetical protein
VPPAAIKNSSSPARTICTERFGASAIEAITDSPAESPARFRRRRVVANRDKTQSATHTVATAIA